MMIGTYVWCLQVSVSTTSTVSDIVSVIICCYCYKTALWTSLTRDSSDPGLYLLKQVCEPLARASAPLVCALVRCPSRARRRTMRLPHLDIAVWRSDPSRFARQLRQACHHDGFFQLRHRIPTPLVEHVKAEARSFFAQGAEQKDAIDYRGSPAFRGYMACGVENTAGRPDLREQVDLAFCCHLDLL